jgi:hypothetical protein
MSAGRPRELHGSTYELFILSLSIPSILNLVLLILPLQDQCSRSCSTSTPR